MESLVEFIIPVDFGAITQWMGTCVLKPEDKGSNQSYKDRIFQIYVGHISFHHSLGGEGKLSEET